VIGPDGSKEYQEHADELVGISAGLTDRQKMIAEYWSDGPYWRFCFTDHVGQFSKSEIWLQQLP